MTSVAAIVGPTAAGKSELAVAVATALGAEIVSIDSMQIYRGMDIGTDKATPEMRAAVPHHLLDLRDASDDVTVAEYQALARAAIAGIEARGRLPLLVGGSGLYFRAVVDDLRFPPRDAALRESLEREADQRGPGALHARLSRLDPAAARTVQPTNTRRIVRGLEVIELTRRRFSDGNVLGEHDSIYELAVAGITRPRGELYRRIEARAGAMLDSGLAEEARGLQERGLARTPSQALGYRQVLEDPSASPHEIRERVVRATKRFARRQESWFRADPRVRWFEAGEPEIVAAVVSFFTEDLCLAISPPSLG